MNCLSLTADQILAIDITKPHKLVDYDTYVYQFQKLRSQWHPDRNDDPQAGDVTRHINLMYTEAEKQVAGGLWKGDAVLVFTTDAGKTMKFRYVMSESFELGTVYITGGHVAYVFDTDNIDLAKNGAQMLASIKYPNAKLKDEFTPLFPTVVGNYQTDVGYVVVLKKQPQCVRLQELVAHQGGAIDPKHVAWMVGCMFNITTFLDFVGIAHNSILPSTIFVDVENHSCMVVGGWWYSVNAGTKMKALPSVVAKAVPSDILKAKLADTRVDRISAKRTALYCLGDQSMLGSKLYQNSDIPKPMLSWLRLPCSNKAVADYQSWDNQLESSFGKRKFAKFDADITSIY